MRQVVLVDNPYENYSRNHDPFEALPLKPEGGDRTVGKGDQPAILNSTPHPNQPEVDYGSEVLPTSARRHQGKTAFVAEDEREFIEIWGTLSGKRIEMVTAAAKALNVSNTTIYRYLEKLPELNADS